MSINNKAYRRPSYIVCFTSFLGGQKSRVALADMASREPDLIILVGILVCCMFRYVYLVFGFRPDSGKFEIPVAGVFCGKEVSRSW